MFRSMRRGATARTYVHVQMRRRMTRRRDWKLNNADYVRDQRRQVMSANMFTMAEGAIALTIVL